MNNMAPPYANDGKSGFFESSSIQSNEHNIMRWDFFQGDEVEQLRTSPNVRESGAESPSSLDSTSVATINAHDFSEHDSYKIFPVLLHAIVSDENLDSVIHWLPCGTRFIVANKDEFSRLVLSQYFGVRGTSVIATKFTSFTRRLKRWNFTRVPSGREMGAYYHESFRRGEPELAKKIAYPIIKGSTPSTSRTSPSSASVAVAKARRRASTGSVAALGSKVKTEDLLDLQRSTTSSLNEANLYRYLDNISPAPVELTASSQLLDNDINRWLSSAEFAVEEFSSPSSSNLNNVFCQEPNGASSEEPIPVTSVSSNSEFNLPKFRPPLACPDVTFEDLLKMGHCPDQAFPIHKKILRRHTELTASSQLLYNDINQWLSSAEFTVEEFSSPSSSNLDNVFCQEPNGASSEKPIPVTSVSSNSEFNLPKLRPPLACPDVTFEDRLKMGHCPDQAFPIHKKILRRHSVDSPFTTRLTMSMEMIPSLNNTDNDWFDLMPFGTNYSQTPHVAHTSNVADTPNVAVSDANSTSFTSNDVSWAGMNQKSPQGLGPPQPRQLVDLTESTSCEEDTSDTSFGEFGYGDVCAIDPFT